jgi:hypothetical protein
LPRSKYFLDAHTTCSCACFSTLGSPVNDICFPRLLFAQSKYTLHLVSSPGAHGGVFFLDALRDCIQCGRTGATEPKTFQAGEARRLAVLDCKGRGGQVCEGNTTTCAQGRACSWWRLIVQNERAVRAGGPMKRHRSRRIFSSIGFGD